MSSNLFRNFVLVLIVGALIVAPWLRSQAQELSIRQDLRSIQVDYGILGKKGFERKLDDILRRHRVNPEEAQIKLAENRRESMVSLEIRYTSSISFLPLTRGVVIQSDFPLRPVE